MSQSHEYSWEFIIADDFSTDGTRAILLEYKEKFPSLVRLVLQEKNVGASQNWKDLINSAKGKYIAYFEGDDFWIDPNKIRKQVSFLEENQVYFLSCHNVFEWMEGKELILSELDNSSGPKTYEIADLAMGNFIHTPSVVFRNIFIDGYPDWIFRSPVGDYILHMLSAERGKIYYFPEPMAVYRKNVGNWSGQSQLVMWEKWLVVLDLLMDHFISHEVFQVLKEQKAKIIAEVFSITRYLEKTVELLKEDPQEIAKNVRLSTLLTAIKLKTKNKLMRSDKKKGVNL